MPETLHCLARF